MHLICVSQFPNFWLKEKKKIETDYRRARNVDPGGWLRDERGSISKPIRPKA